jgi:hypothetical protein
MPHLDAQADFARARRHAQLARVAAWLSREPHSVGVILPFEEVVAALGFLGERDLGPQVVMLDTIVGSVDRTRDFDRNFRPTSPRTRGRWEGIATAMRRGQALPPISLYRIGEMHFVRDGHHRVSVARALGHKDIDAHVTEVQTRVGAERAIVVTDLPLKGHERLFWERVPLVSEVRHEIRLSDPWDYGDLAEGIEAWGFRAMQQREELLDRQTVARMWLEEEYRPVIALLREAGLIDDPATETRAYMDISAERYRLLRTHAWDGDVLAQLDANR